MNKVFEMMRERAKGALFAFVAITDVSQSGKLSTLYSNNQDLAGFLNSAFRVAIVAGAILAVLRLAYAGYLYMGSDMWGNKEKAKTIMQDVFLGLLLLLSIYIILAQINPDILKLKVDLAPVTPGAPATFGTGAPLSELDRLNEATVRGMFQNAGVQVNHPACLNVGDTGCTNVGNLSYEAVLQVVHLANQCQCGVIQVTGGTESWLHSANTTHRPGGSTIDISKSYNQDFNRFVLNNGGTPVQTTSGMRYTVSGIGTFTDETIDGNTPHWHVTLF